MSSAAQSAGVPAPVPVPVSALAEASEAGLIGHVTAELERNFGEQIRLRDIESTSGFSVYQIIRAFRRDIGTTPHAYMMRLRVDYAALRLEAGDTIAGAAAEAGFADQSHMTRHFKRVFGTTPGKFMRQAHQACA